MALEADSEREAEWKREKRKKTDKQRVRERKRPSNGRKKKDCSLCRRFRGPWPSEEAADSLYEYGRSWDCRRPGDDDRLKGERLFNFPFPFKCILYKKIPRTRYLLQSRYKLLN